MAKDQSPVDVKEEEGELALPDNWRVLVADDSSMLRKCNIKLLDKINGTWTFDEADSGERVLELVSSPDKYDLVLLDENMAWGGLKGTDTTKLLRAKGIKCLVIGLTGSECEEYTKMALAKGQDHVLGKPFTDHEAFARLVLGLRRGRGGRVVVRPVSSKPRGTVVVQADEYPKYVPVEAMIRWSDETTLPSELPAVDTTFLTKLTGGDEDEVQGLLNDFKQEIKGHRATILSDGKNVRSAGTLFNMYHELKGTAAQLGAIGIQKAAFDVVQKLKSGSGAVTEETTHLIAEFDRFLET